jgi:hypothetical protein
LPEIRIEEENPEFARGKCDDLPVDFLFTRNKLFSKVAKSFTSKKKFADRTVPCASIEAIVMLTLFALPSLYRQGRFEKVDLYQNDVLRLMREYKPHMPPLLKELSQHVLASDLTEIKSIVDQIEKEIAESQQRFRDNP